MVKSHVVQLVLLVIFFGDVHGSNPPLPQLLNYQPKKKKHLELDNMFLAHNSSTTFCFLANSNIFIFKTSCPFEGTHKIVIILRKI